MSKSAEQGKQHVLDVCEALRRYLNGHSIADFIDPIQQTVTYITNRFQTIQSVSNKYEHHQSDSHPSLYLHLNDGQTVKMNLYRIVGKGAVQPTNPGAKSFLTKYFQAEPLQKEFNTYVEQAYKVYLESLIKLNNQSIRLTSIKQLREEVKKRYPKFTDELELIRKSFLVHIRDYCFQLFSVKYNEGTEAIQQAYKKLMRLDAINIITRYTKGNKCLFIEELKFSINSSHGIDIYKKGNDTIGIRSGNEALTLRFKFESSPTSSIKLAASYERFPTEDATVQMNMQTIQLFEHTVQQYEHIYSKNTSNAIGKCNEAAVYYRLLKMNPSVYQVDSNEFQTMIARYAPSIEKHTLHQIIDASASAVDVIHAYLKDKYESYTMDSIQLIPESYLKDKKDTRDLLLILRVNAQYVEEGFSLKAIAKSKLRVTVKNPGAGTILGSLYFDIGTLSPYIEQTKEAFLQNKMTHTQALEVIAKEMANQLQNASQENLKRGVTTILGVAPKVITAYPKNKSKMIQHGEIQGPIIVYPSTPSAIQTKLSWDNQSEELFLRLKFSSGQEKGWSSLKLACEYEVEV